jgi:hypothetical protein
VKISHKRKNNVFYMELRVKIAFLSHFCILVFVFVVFLKHNSTLWKSVNGFEVQFSSVSVCVCVYIYIYIYIEYKRKPGDNKKIGSVTNPWLSFS